MYFLIFEIIILFIFVILLILILKSRIRKLATYSSPLTGEINVWEKSNGERLLTTNGFSQGVSVGSVDLTMSYWNFQAQQIINHCRGKKTPRILWLGLGAATGPHLVARGENHIRQTAVEFDSEIIKSAKKYFSLETISHFALIQNDAYKEVITLAKKKEYFDAVSVDVYTSDAPQNGEKLRDKEFLQTVFHLLKPDGLLLINRLAHKEEEREKTKLLERFLREYFKDVKKEFIHDTRGYKNEILVASRR